MWGRTAIPLAALFVLIASLPATVLADSAPADRDRPAVVVERSARADDTGWRERLALRNDRHDTAYASPVHPTGARSDSHDSHGVPLASKPFYRPSVIVPGPALGL
ncbi:MAG: hypothetical protein U1F33_14500 [Alphaproteobacteria bacterium]